MAGELTPEQEEFLKRQLNLFERFGQSLSFIDEYSRLLIETQNKILAELQVLAGMQGPGNQALADAINNLVATLGGTPVLQNPPRIASGELLCPVAGTAVPMPNYEIPWDMELIIKALSTNLGIVRVGNTAMEAQNILLGYPLIANEAIGYKIKNSQQLWICANVANEGIHWTVEQE